MKKSALPKPSVCFYFQVHQPYRLSETSFFNDDPNFDYFKGPSKSTNQFVFEKVAKKCYIPATKLILELLKTHPEFRVAYSISGVFIDQCEEFGEIGKQVLSLFQKIAKTGQAEFLGETYFHSLSFLYAKEEWADQIALHAKKIKTLFGKTPKIFRNTELIYNNEIAEFIRQMGFHGILAEGWDPLLEGREPNYVYWPHKMEIHPEDARIAKKYAIEKVKKQIPVLLKNYKLSDDIAFRFGNKGWKEHPLTADKFANWVEATPADTVNLFMDYETLGEHQWEDTGIFEFLKHLPSKLLEKGILFRTPSETLAAFEPKEEYNVPYYLSWADTDRNLSAWLENDIQKSALGELSDFEKKIFSYKQEKNSELQKILRDFRKLQTSDHLYYMSTKYFNDGDVHKYFSPYSSDHSPYEAYIHFMNVMRQLRQRLEMYLTSKIKLMKSKKF